MKKTKLQLLGLMSILIFLMMLSGRNVYAADDVTIKLEARANHTELAGKLVNNPDTWLTVSFGEQVKNVEQYGCFAEAGRILQDLRESEKAQEDQEADIQIPRSKTQISQQ